MMKAHLTAVLLFIFISPCIAEAAEPGFWYELLGSDEKTFTERLSKEGFSFIYSDIEPGLLDSRAGRIIYFSAGKQDTEGVMLSGLTVWFIDGEISQLRFDRNAAGTICGLAIGSSAEEVLGIFGMPWIENEDSLYYNLSWRGAPVRLRFVFDGSVNAGRDGRLSEVYLYQVR